MEDLKKSVGQLGENIDALLANQAELAAATKALQEKTEKLEANQNDEVLKEEVKRLETVIDELVKAKNSLNLEVSGGSNSQTDYGKNFKNMDDFYRAVKYRCSGKGLPVDSAKFLQEGTEPGSFLVPTEFVPTVIDYLPKYENLVEETFRLPWGSTGNKRSIPNLAALPQAYFVSEGSRKPNSSPSFSLITQVLKVIEVMIVLTNQLMEDAGINLSTFLPEWARRAIMNTWLKAMFLGDTSDASNPVIGIDTASGVLTPTGVTISNLFPLKRAVPVQIRATGKFYVEGSVYDRILALVNNTKPIGYAYDNVTGKLTIDGSPVVALDASVIGEGNVFFGDLSTIIFSPKRELYVRWSDQATITDTDGTTQINLFEKNMQAFLFESRADLTVIGSVWSKAEIEAAA